MSTSKTSIINYGEYMPCTNGSHLFLNGSDRCSCGSKSVADYHYINSDTGNSFTVDWTGKPTEEEEETKWQNRAHLGELESEIKTLRDAVIMYGTSNLIISTIVLGILFYVILQ